MQFQLASKKALFDKKNSTHYIFAIDESSLHTLDDFKVGFHKFLGELAVKIKGEEDNFKVSLF